MNLDNIKKYLDFYMIYCKQDYDMTVKYRGQIDHISYPKENVEDYGDYQFRKIVNDYTEVTSINPIILMFSFIPTKRYLKFARKNTQPISMWTSDNIADTILVEHDTVLLDDCDITVYEKQKYDLTSEEVISETNEINDVWMERVTGNKPYIDLDKLMKKTNKILSDDLGFTLDFESFTTLLDKGEIDGKRISRSNREYE